MSKVSAIGNAGLKAEARKELDARIGQPVVEKKATKKKKSILSKKKK